MSILQSAIEIAATVATTAPASNAAAAAHAASGSVPAASLPASSSSSIPTYKGVELLFDYTKFHIGLYLTLATLFITAASVKVGDAFVLPVYKPFVWASVLCLLLAGFAGGNIVSSITQCFDALPTGACPTTQAFMDSRIGPYDWKLFEGRTWMAMEHTAFWVGALFACLSFTKWRARIDVRIFRTS